MYDGILAADDYCKVIDVCNPTDAPTESPTPAPIETIITPEPTPSPVTPAPVTPAPIETIITPVPTPSPIETPAPVTPAPIEIIITTLIPTPSPVTPAPIETPVPTLSDTPAPTPCESRKWYMITSEGDGHTTCTNGYDTMGDGATIYDTFLECCEAEVTTNGMGSAADCKYIDVCNPTDVPTPSPIDVATLPPVPEVVTTFEPTM